MNLTSWRSQVEPMIFRRKFRKIGKRSSKIAQSLLIAQSRRNVSLFFPFGNYHGVSGEVREIGKGRSARPLCAWKTDWPFDCIVLRARTPQVSEILTENTG